MSNNVFMYKDVKSIHITTLMISMSHSWTTSTYLTYSLLLELRLSFLELGDLLLLDKEGPFSLSPFLLGFSSFSTFLGFSDSDDSDRRAGRFLSSRRRSRRLLSRSLSGDALRCLLGFLHSFALIKIPVTLLTAVETSVLVLWTSALTGFGSLPRLLYDDPLPV